jgi:hypothetical protein
MNQGCRRGHRKLEVRRVDTSERTEGRAERRACSFAGVAVDLAWALPLIIPRPRAPAVADGGVSRMAASLAPPCVRG